MPALQDVGLGYIRLGQPATTLSGGVAQRVKLSRELSKRATGRTFYVLDEPSVGLHAADVDKLIAVLNRLVDAGNTVVIIEHHPDIIKVADWLIDLGPEGGERGGEIVAVGTPEQMRNQQAIVYRTVLAQAPAQQAVMAYSKRDDHPADSVTFVASPDLPIRVTIE